MGYQVNPVSAYWLLTVMVGRLQQECEGHAPSYTMFMLVLRGLPWRIHNNYCYHWMREYSGTRYLSLVAIQIQISDNKYCTLIDQSDDVHACTSCAVMCNIMPRSREGLLTVSICAINDVPVYQDLDTPWMIQ